MASIRIGKVNVKRSLVIAILAVITIPFAIILKNRNYISPDTMMWTLIIAASVAGFVLYSEYRSKTLPELFHTSHKTIEVLDAAGIFRDTLELEWGMVVKSMYASQVYYQDEAIGDQVAHILVTPIYGKRFIAPVPLQRGEKAIKGLSFPFYYDLTPTFRKKYHEMFAMKRRKDMFKERALRMALPEQRPEVFANIAKDEENGKDKEDEEDEK